MLALFMISMGDTRPHQHFWVPVDLAVAANPSPQPAALREDVMRVSIQRDGRVFFRNLRTQAERLPDLIREAVRQGAEAKVYLAVDARSKYGDTNAVVEQIKLSGVSRLCFLVEKAAPK
jgi:biopolymer transport protein ExbD